MIGLNIVVVAAAGNNGTDACNYSPSSANGVLTFGGSNQKDAITADPASNFGNCVNMYAPGYQIPSINNNGGFSVMR